ncbi:MAG: GAF domain-containing sensor histidine kinase [Chloroflexi bacterium]|nr:GAF domain-containing sensor histidine kinase [Chloroflexota bacterium]MCC6891284.1 GAF domain-containing sensor histidine kinase [Anaerolineae bacterium]
MAFFNTVSLLSNGLTLALSLGFLLIVLWNDVRKELNQFFAAFLLLVMLWNVGSLFTLALSIISPNSSVIKLAITIMEIGFTGSSIALYTMTAILVGVHTRRFRLLAFTSLFLIVGYQAVLIFADAPIQFSTLGNGFFKYRFAPLSAIFYLMFDGVTLYLVWRYRRKIRSHGLFIGLNLFAISQSLGFLNPELQVASLSITLGGVSALLISFAMLRREIITPLAERITQVESVHKVSLAITSHIALDRVMNQIATQAVTWLNADASGIFLKNDRNQLELVSVYDLPSVSLHLQIDIGDGVAGRVAETKQSIYLENYVRDWKGIHEFAYGTETFGSVIGVPLIYSESTIGVLLVIAGKQGRLFQKQDVQLLELLGAQAAVAIAHSRLFGEQQSLTQQVEAAHNQLQTVLTSTENPVAVVNRKLQLVFANPAFRRLFKDTQLTLGEHLINLTPRNLLPSDFRAALRDLRQKQAHIYEVSINNQTYLCHVASLGQPQSSGWVAVLNDISQLKELDRLKSEMIRMASHDLKNPLQAAMANLELLHDDLELLRNPEIDLSMTAINTQLTRMNKIINGVLDLERIKSGQLLTEVCTAEQVVNEVMQDMRYLASEKRITLQAEIGDDLPHFKADPDQFGQALVNLVENAIKFTKSNGHVIIKVGLEKNRLCFAVQDNGIGIPPELQEHVFERFWRGGQRGQNGAEHITGTGLGLSLVKTIVENHSGEVRLTSTPGIGTVFYVLLPAMIEAQPTL